MRKFYDTESEEIFTEDQIYAFWCQDSQLDYPNYNLWLREVTGKNGTLEELASDWDIDNKRKWTAVKIAAQSNLEYSEVYNMLQEHNVHGNWTIDEINNRPVDVDELVELCYEWKEERR